MPVRTKKEKQCAYACFIALKGVLEESAQVSVQQNDSLYAAHQAYMDTPELKAVRLDEAAKAAVRMLKDAEPRLRMPVEGQSLQLVLQDEPEDERDIVCRNTHNGWEVGVSCRLSHARRRMHFGCFTDFGQEWFLQPCSNEYYEKIRPIFDELRALEERNGKWKDMPRKEERFFYLFQNALLSELKRMDEAHPGKIPAAMLVLLAGKKDFYRMVPDENKGQTRLEACNLFGTLGLSQSRGKGSRITKLKFPHTFFQASKRIINDVFVLATDEGWAYSFRVGGCGGKVEAQLCVDLELVGVPRDIYTQTESW